MSRRITLLNEDHEWLVRIMESMERKAKREAAIWVDHLNQIERIKDALYTADPGFDELFPDEPPASVEGNGKDAKPARAKARAKTAPPPVKAKAAPAVAEKKPRAKRGERLATLPQLCKDHPAYGGIRVPRTDCPGCWKAWGRNRSPGEVAKAKDRMLGKGRG
jgi:hypothetical protein